MEKPSVYIETTVISYLTARPSRDLIIAAHQQVTREWWDIALPLCQPFVSPVVLAEAGRGDPEAAQLRLNSISDFAVLEVNREVNHLAERYFNQTQIPEKSRADAFHLALATIHGMDYLVSWNFTHILGASIQAKVQQINASLGLGTPVICSPEEAMEV